jgi:hypothetical protein
MTEKGHEEQFPLQASAAADGFESGLLRLTITPGPRGVAVYSAVAARAVGE